ncbi:MAG: hypothetical protein ACRCZP_14545, partial [Phycicoccus sp.]
NQEEPTPVTIRRVQSGSSGHRYIDATGAPVPGVTTVIGAGLPKPALINWAGNATADYAVDHWDDLSRLKPAARLAKLRKARYEDRDRAGNQGTAVHAIAEQLARGEEVEVPDHLAGHAESYVQFLDEWQPEPILVEAIVVSHRHGYAGTLDLVARIDLGAGDQIAILDLKTSRSGIFGEVALQLAAYRYADAYVDADGAEQPMPVIDRVLAVHCRADGYDLYPITAGPEQLRAWLYVREVARFADQARDLIGATLTPAGRHPRRRLTTPRETR